MKNKLLIFLILIKFTFSFQIPLFSDEIKFEAENIETIDENLIIANNNIVVNDNYGNKIYGDKLEIKDKKVYIISGNVIFENTDNTIILNTDKINYNENTSIVKTFGNTNIEIDNSYFLNTSNISYNLLTKKIFSGEKSLIKDSNLNKIELDEFTLYLKKNILKANQANIIDKNLNQYEIEKLIYDLKEKIILGKDVSINEDNKLSSERYLPRAKGRSLELATDSMILRKSIYTNCKKRDGCPPWSFKAEEVTHDKKKKTINYKNASFRFYDVPVLYFPKFFHPDPTVDRQSGFLAPSLLAQKKGNYLKTPYFYVLNNSSDFTFSPRFYDNQENIYQGEYRKVTKNSKHTFDASIKNKNTFISGKNASQTHFFYKSTINTNFDLFDYSKFDIQFQNVSNDKYIKTFDLSSPLIDDATESLNSKIEFEGSKDDLEFYVNTEVYEDLTKENDSDKYEFIFPNFNLSKNIETKLDGSLEIISKGYNKLFETNINERILINDLKFKSFDAISTLGFVNNFEFLIKNFNADSRNSKTLKNGAENRLKSIFQFSSKIPLKKESEKFISTITPKFVGKFNPQKNKNIRTQDRLIDYSNVYSINRINSEKTVEGGQSLTFGNEYKLFSRKNQSEELFGLNLAASFRPDENLDLPENSYLGQKTSNIIGRTKLKFNNLLDFEHDFLTDNNMKDFIYHKLNSKFTINNFVSSFELIEEHDKIGTTHFISNETSLKIGDNKNLLFRTRKNRTTDLTEYYKLIYQYKLDCLVASMEYNKDYYRDGTIEPEESISLSLTIMPFDNTLNIPKIGK